MNFDLYKRIVIRHEVGHWAVAKLLGYEVGKIEIRIDHSPQGFGHHASAHIKLHPSFKSIRDIESFLINRVAILWAGIIYQSTVDERSVDEVRDTDGANDHQKLKELCFVIRGIRFPEQNSQEFEHEQLKSINDECWNKAKQLIETNSDAIKRLANQIERKVSKCNVNFTVQLHDLCNWFHLDEDTA